MRRVITATRKEIRMEGREGWGEGGRKEGSNGREKEGRSCDWGWPCVLCQSLGQGAAAYCSSTFSSTRKNFVSCDPTDRGTG